MNVGKRETERERNKKTNDIFQNQFSDIKKMPEIVRVESEKNSLNDSTGTFIKEMNKMFLISPKLEKKKTKTNYLFKRNISSNIDGEDNRRESNSLIKLKNNKIFEKFKLVNGNLNRNQLSNFKRSSTHGNKTNHNMVKMVNILY
jgi:uncharacterized ubiquitin-like protein YukD